MNKSQGITDEARNTYEWYLDSFKLLSFQLTTDKHLEMLDHLQALQDILNGVPRKEGK